MLYTIYVVYTMQILHIVYTTIIVYTMICVKYKSNVIYNMINWACYVHQIMHIQQIYVIYNLKCYIQQEFLKVTIILRDSIRQ